MKKIIFTALLSFFMISVFSQTMVSTQPHNGTATHGTFAPDGSFYSVGDDGFVIKWNSENKGEHYQISDLEIKYIAASPNGTDIAIYETDGYSVNRISIWNWKTKRRLVVKRFTDTISTINFSEKGSWLMIGTNSVDGIIFLNAKTGTVLRKVKESPGMVTMIYSSSTENSGIMYTPLGKLIYTNFKTGVTKQAVSVETNLTQPTLFNSDLLFAGIKNDYIYIYHSVTGDLLAKIYEKNAQIISTRDDSNLYYLVKDGRNYVLKMIQSGIEKQQIITQVENPITTQQNNQISNVKSPNDKDVLSNQSDILVTDTEIEQNEAPEKTYTQVITEKDVLFFEENPVIVKTIYTDGRSEISALTKNNTDILALCENGTIQKTSVEPNLTISKMENISPVIYAKIYDIAVMNENFYFLTDKDVFSSSYTDQSITTVKANNGYTNLLSYQNSLIFYSKNKASNVVISDLNSQTEKVLYKATGSIQNIHLKDGFLLIIEGSSKVVLVDIEKATSKVVYTGVGIQDAILYTENDIYVAKTAASSPNSALIHVDANTQETVIVPINGEVAFSLTQSTSSNIFYGVCVYSGTTKRTDIFAYYPDSKKYTAIFQWGDEDTDAFTTFRNGYLYSNIGKTQVLAVNVSTRRSTSLSRFASLPQKLESNSSLMVVLNEDGSISWYNAKTNSLYANWYVTVEGNWIEY